jgi:kynurenine formamidase
VYSRELSLPEHSGTHIDAPAHFALGGLTTDAIPLELFVRPAVVLDVRQSCGDDPEFTLLRPELERFEDRDGQIDAGSAVLICTGWDRHRSERARYLGPDASNPAFPGIGPDVATCLVERGVVGIGIDTLGIEPGYATDFPAHRITQAAGLWHLECLVNLHLLPPRGAWLVAAAPPVVGGSGTPVRAFAVLPEP